MKSLRTKLMVTTCILLSACAVGPDYTAPDMKVSDQWVSAGSESSAEQQIQAEWWTIFKDPLLESYIQKAAANNNDIKAALANVRRARALSRESGAAFLPQVDSSARGDRSRGSDNLASSGDADASSMFDAGFDASWELDIFGGTRRSVEAANARTSSAVAEYHNVMLTVLSEVARNYYEARGLQKRIAITERNAGFFRKTFDLVNDRVKAGESSDFDLSRAQGQYQLTSARLPNLKADLDASVFRLSVLLGQPPEALLTEMAEVKPLPTPPDVVPVGLRSDLLRRRPDIAQAERELAASTADIGVETAELFPKFFLTGSAGAESRVFGDLFSAAAGAWSLGSLVQWPLFQGGAIQARIEAAEENSQAALANYQQTVLEALSDTETALTRYGRELETRKRLADAVNSRRKSAKLAQELFDAGEQDYLAVLDAGRELTASEDDLVVSETQSITKLIALYTVLGGGWEVFAPQDAAAIAE